MRYRAKQDKIRASLLIEAARHLDLLLLFRSSFNGACWSYTSSGMALSKLNVHWTAYWKDAIGFGSIHHLLKMFYLF